MRIPQLPILQDKSKVVIPTGGINVSKLPSEINENQLSDGLNVFYRDGILKFRPGLIKKIEQTYGKIIDVYPKDGTETILKKLTYILKGMGFYMSPVNINRTGIYLLTARAVLTYGKSTGDLYDNIEEVPTGAEMIDGVWVYHYYDPSNTSFQNSKFLPSLKVNVQEYDSAETHYIMSGNMVYIVGENNETMTVTQVVPQLIIWPFPMGTIHIEANYFVVNEFPKIPVIYTNMVPTGGGDALESRNYITPTVKNEFITNGTDTVYHLIDKVVDNENVSITYDNLSGIIITWVFDTGVTVRLVLGITATLNRTAGTITFSVALVNAAAVETKTPNMTIQYSKLLYAEPNPIKQCKIASWFGGNYQGQISGDSIFLSGNIDKPNAVYWSAVGDPTYYPESNTDYIGSPADPITAFGKNFGQLVILKRNSIYSKGFFWDSVAQKESFPTSEININFGCDIPNSVQLINNNLTWAHSKGGIYTIATKNTNNERNIIPISKNINALLLKESAEDLQNAVSLDDGFYYWLFVGTSVYLWDYNSTPFIDYSDILKAQNRLAWYHWTIPFKFTTAFLYNGYVWGTSIIDNFLYRFEATKFLDDTTYFDAYITSKLFDFEIPTMSKQIYNISVGLSSVGVAGSEITLTDDMGDMSLFETIVGGNVETVNTISKRVSTSWTRQFKLSIKRLDNSAFSISNFEIKAHVGRDI